MQCIRDSKSLTSPRVSCLMLQLLENDACEYRACNVYSNGPLAICFPTNNTKSSDHRRSSCMLRTLRSLQRSVLVYSPPTWRSVLRRSESHVRVTLECVNITRAACLYRKRGKPSRLHPDTTNPRFYPMLEKA